MTTPVIRSLDDPSIVRKVVNELLEAGLERRDITIMEGEPEDIAAEIVERGVSQKEARRWAEAAGRGEALVVAGAPDSKVERIVTIMERREGAAGKQKAKPSSVEGETVPVVQEELAVGKHKVASGGVRVTTNVIERPVKATVSLREEHVEADRHKVSRELSPEEAEAAFEERTVEMMGTTEEVEVGKVAHVVEEVSLGKRVEEHQETVRDKVRRTDVDVEEIGAKSRKAR